MDASLSDRATQWLAARDALAVSQRRALAALLAVLLLTYLIEIRHGLPNRDVVWGYDSNPLLPLIAAKRIFLDGWNTGWHTPYPNFHYYVLLVFIAPYMAVQWLLGNLAGLRMDAGYPYGLRDFDTIFMHLALITRFVSGVMAVGTAYWVYRIGRALHSHAAGLFAAAIAGFSPAVVYYVHVETLDVPMLFWLSAALFCYVRAMQTLELRYCVGMSVLAAVSMATKDYAYGAFVLVPFALIGALARQLSGSLSWSSVRRACVDRRTGLSLLAFVAAFALAENWIWNFSGFVGHLKLAGGLEVGSGQVITTSFGRMDYFSVARLRSGATILIFVLGWAGAALCALGLVYGLARKAKGFAMLAWPAIGLYVFTVCPVLPAGSLIERPYMPLLVILAAWAGIGLAEVTTPLRWRRTAVGVALGAVAFNGAAMDSALVNDPRYQAEAWLAANAHAGTRVELYGLRSELPRMHQSAALATYSAAASRPGDAVATPERVASAALAARAPDVIVLSWAFETAYANASRADGTAHLYDFVAGLRDGRLGYEARATFESKISQALMFPPRLMPSVTVFGKK
jgi:4-amino-4-deoxy-L-arabinose transferase-like glycosyltransferase